MDKSSIAILTTVINFKLYEITSNFFPKGIRKYVIDGRNGMHGIHSLFYMFKKLKKRNIDWLILADEDVIFTKPDIVFKIINKMKNDNICVSGIRDGGVIWHRCHNPITVNTFFTIINFKEISKIWNINEIKKNQYILPNEFKVSKGYLNEFYDMNSLSEPYYCFFLWLKRKKKIFFYLDAEIMDDNISNNIIFNNEVFAYHTWYARGYGVIDKHTNRINDFFSKLELKISGMDSNLDVVVFKDSFFYFKMKVKKSIKNLF